MSVYRSADDFVEAVENEIKWKRAKKCASQELRNHIEDNYNELLSRGYDSDSAREMSIHKMGNPKTIGNSLNSVYRPSWNCLLIGLAVVFVILDFILVKGSVLRYGNPLWVAAGFVLALAIMLIDYTVLCRQSEIIIWIYSAATVAALLYDLLFHRTALGYDYSYYLIILSPLPIIGLIAGERNEGRKNHHLQITTWCAAYLATAFLIHSGSAILTLILLDAVLLIYCIWVKHIYETKLSIIVFGMVILAAAVIFVFMLPGFEVGIDPADSSYLEYIRNTLFIGGYPDKQSVIQSIVINSHPLLVLVVYYGKIVIIAVLLIYTLLFFLLFRSMKRQSLLYGKWIVFFTIVLFLIQIVITFFADLGIIYGTLYMGYPFLTGGGKFFVCNYALLGLVLSVSWNEAIARRIATI